MQELRVQSLGWEVPLEEGMATHSSILAWKILWTEEPGGIQSMGSKNRTGLSDFTFTFTTLKLGFPLMVQMVKNLLPCRKPGLHL